MNLKKKIAEAKDYVKTHKLQFIEAASFVGCAVGLVYAYKKHAEISHGLDVLNAELDEACAIVNHNESYVHLNDAALDKVLNGETLRMKSYIGDPDLLINMDLPKNEE